MVIAIITVIVGLVSLSSLPVAQYPEITPPMVSVTATYTGANAIAVEESVATPIEQKVNGVEDMIYMKSVAGSDGSLALTVTFALGTDPDQAQVQVQNRVSQALPRLPEDVRRLGVTTQKQSPNLMMAVHLEGCTRNAGKHAGGVVISPTTITDFAALYCDDEGKFPVTQFDKNDVETAGLVKFDFLGLDRKSVV